MYIWQHGGLGDNTASQAKRIPLTMRPKPYLILDRFDYNKPSLTPLLRGMVRYLAKGIELSWKSTQPFEVIRLIGHTDNTGQEKYNVGLGNRRAWVVEIALKKKLKLKRLLDQIRIVVEPSPGASEPTADNSTKEGRERNRRVEVFIITGAAPTVTSFPQPTPIDLRKSAEDAAQRVEDEAEKRRQEQRYNQPVPAPAPGKSISAWLDERLARLPQWLRSRIRDAILKGACTLLETLLGQAVGRLNDQEKDDLRKICLEQAKKPTPRGSAGLGWFIDTRIGTAKTPAGHEILTERAAGGIITKRADLLALVDGARRPDLADPSDHIKLGEQNRHFLRSIKQPAWAAWFLAIDHLRLLHQGMMAGTSRADQFRLIGEALHLIQDSFAPAHVERELRTGDIQNIRIYDPKAPPGNHLFLTDARDAIFIAQPPMMLTAGARKAIAASSEYLKMALMHLRLKQSPLALLGQLAKQTTQDLNAFIARRLWFRFPDLKVGAQGWPVSVLHGSLNNWLVVHGSNLPSLQGPTFDADTRNTVLEFQQSMKLTADGTVGRKTWRKLLLP